ncbi:MAG TPA: RES family NAD+ phosphorylase [Solirubrobacterales bacterium]
MTIAFRELPVRRLEPGQRLYRIHRAAHGPWFFSGDGNGRFDPATTGRGACYLAEAALGAWIETFRTSMTIAEDDVSSRVLSSIELDRPFELADLSHRRALAAGATAAVMSGEDYDPCHATADGLQGVRDGILWRVRHDLGQRLLGVALFGPAGAQPDGDWPPADTAPIGSDLIRVAEDEFGYRVVPTT